MDWKTEKKANSMLIVQDPGDTTPHQTGRLCAVHNAENPSDKTAQQALHLWNAAVSLDHHNPSAGGYLKQHFWTNSIMHGASGKTGLRERTLLKSALKRCSNVLGMQIEALRPSIVIASGEHSVNSLFDLGIIEKNWTAMRSHFSRGAYREEVEKWRGLKKMVVFCTYHTSARVVNQTLSRAYDPIKTEQFIKQKIAELPSIDSVAQFFSTYRNPETNSRAAGMRFLLNHWIDIGMEIRSSSKKC